MNRRIQWTYARSVRRLKWRTRIDRRSSSRNRGFPTTERAPGGGSCLHSLSMSGIVDSPGTRRGGSGGGDVSPTSAPSAPRRPLVSPPGPTPWRRPRPRPRSRLRVPSRATRKSPARSRRRRTPLGRVARAWPRVHGVGALPSWTACRRTTTTRPPRSSTRRSTHASAAPRARPSRVLDTLVELGLVRRVEHPGSAARRVRRAVSRRVLESPCPASCALSTRRIPASRPDVVLTTR